MSKQYNISNPKFRVKRKTPQNKTRVKKKLKFSKEIIQKQQERLILLRHASQCKDKNCKIKVCPKAKSLWKHIIKCEDNNCNFKLCLSSRYVLTHYHRCKDKKCKVCVPVRKKIAINDAAYTLINLNK